MSPLQQTLIHERLISMLPKHSMMMKVHNEAGPLLVVEFQSFPYGLYDLCLGLAWPKYAKATMNIATLDYA